MKSPSYIFVVCILTAVICCIFTFGVWAVIQSISFGVNCNIGFIPRTNLSSPSIANINVSVLNGLDSTGNANDITDNLSITSIPSSINFTPSSPIYGQTDDVIFLFDTENYSNSNIKVSVTSTDTNTKTYNDFAYAESEDNFNSTANARCIVESSTTLTAIPSQTFTISVAEETIDTANFTITNNVLTSYTGSKTELLIPESVTTFGNGTSEIFSNSITNVKLSSNVTTLANKSISSGMLSLKIPNSINVISLDAFVEATSLEYLDVDNSNLTYTAYKGSLYTKNKSNLLMVPKLASNISLPDETTIISSNAFVSTNEVEINISNNSNFVENNGILYNSTLTDLIKYEGTGSTINIPSSVTKICSHAFNNCSAVHEVVLLDTTNLTIEENAFSSSSFLEIYFPLSTNPFDATTLNIDDNAFVGNTYLIVLSSQLANWNNFAIIYEMTNLQSKLFSKANYENMISIGNFPSSISFSMKENDYYYYTFTVPTTRSYIFNFTFSSYGSIYFYGGDLGESVIYVDTNTSQTISLTAGITYTMYYSLLDSLSISYT